MANDLNQCFFVGRLAADPETAFLPSGDGVTKFRLAVGWKGKDKEGVEWVPCVAFGKLSEICAEYLTKGKQVLVVGSYKTRSWEKDGEKRYSTEIVVNTMQMLGSKDDTRKSSGSGKPYTGSGYGHASANSQPIPEDDIPF